MNIHSLTTEREWLPTATPTALFTNLLHVHYVMVHNFLLAYFVVLKILYQGQL